MWFMLNDCFLSIVNKDCARDELMVRARRPGDIEKLFPKAQVTEYTASDYHYRAAVKRTELAEALVGEISRVTYSNFKDSVQDKPLHDAYLRVWHAMAALQPKRPYAGASWNRGRSLFDFGDSTKGIEDLEARAPARGKGKKKAAAK
jgi:hypothetical protein